MSAATPTNGTMGKLMMAVLSGLLILILFAQYQKTGELTERVISLEGTTGRAVQDIATINRNLSDPSDEQLRRWRREAAAQDAGRK